MRALRASASKEQKRFVKFALVGSLGAVIDFSVMNLLSHLFNMRLVYAGTLSFVCAVISNFIWHRHWTYPESRSRHLVSQLGMFFIVNLAGVAIRLPILKYIEPQVLNAIERIFHSTYLTSEFYARNLTLALAVGIVMLWNFFVNRYWTYNDVDGYYDKEKT
ncbi:MAG: GtrA family protein [Anaerolineales bacterium]|nr:GtrA family protein [Anaerolineales bacterium]